MCSKTSNVYDCVYVVGDECLSWKIQVMMCLHNEQIMFANTKLPRNKLEFGNVKRRLWANESWIVYDDSESID